MTCPFNMVSFQGTFVHFFGRGKHHKNRWISRLAQHAKTHKVILKTHPPKKTGTFIGKHVAQGSREMTQCTITREILQTFHKM